MPEPGVGEVLLRLRRVGFCGSDLNTFRGRNPLVSFPRVPGHELGAEIAALGPGVPAHFQVGQRVTVSPYLPCGQCAACRRQRPNACRRNQTLGVQRQGAMAPWHVEAHQRVFPVADLSFAELALVEPLTIGAHAVGRAQITAEDTVAVIGCGAVGLGVVAAAAARGAQVIALDLAEDKLALARQCGAQQTLVARGDDLAHQLQDLTGGEGPAVVIEAVGLPSTFRLAVEAVAFAGRVVYIGYAQEPVAYETKLFVMKELDIRGSRNALPSDFQVVIELLRQRRLPASAMISRVVSLAEAGAALAEWSANPAVVTRIQVEFPA